jgi:hypothetical protein
VTAWRLLLVSLLLAGPVTPAAAQVDLSVTPAMTRGPERAPITIVEFFDFE